MRGASTVTVVAAIAFHHQSVACYKIIPNLHHFNIFQYNENARSSTIKSRRKFVSTLASAIPPVILPHTIQAAEDNLRDITTTKEIAQYIKKHANQSFLRSVIESDYNFLYRGLSSDSTLKLENGNNIATVVADEPFDLLDFETYGSDEAVKYFQSLEVQMNDGNKLSMRPSNSHIATTCPKEAAKWGAAVSIWPLSEQGVQFAWLENGGIFWPVSTTSREIAHNNGTPGIESGRGLSHALKGDAWEIMFQADNGFLAVLATYDDELKQLLRQMYDS